MELEPGTYTFGPDDSGGRLLVTTGHTGVASKLGKDLTIEVTEWKGELEIGEDPSDTRVKLTADGGSLEVKGGEGGPITLTDLDKESLSETINEEVLEGTEIKFRSTSAQPSQDQKRICVEGELEMFDESTLVEFELEVHEPSEEEEEDEEDEGGEVEQDGSDGEKEDEARAEQGDEARAEQGDEARAEQGDEARAEQGDGGEARAEQGQGGETRAGESVQQPEPSQEQRAGRGEQHGSARGEDQDENADEWKGQADVPQGGSDEEGGSEGEDEGGSEEESQGGSEEETPGGSEEESPGGSEEGQGGWEEEREGDGEGEGDSNDDDQAGWGGDKEDPSITGRAVFRQTELGLEPHSTLFGLLKVTDEVEVTFEGKLRK